jgi:uncharacterized membrane protein YsdA (DUF1294 family)
MCEGIHLFFWDSIDEGWRKNRMRSDGNSGFFFVLILYILINLSVFFFFARDKIKAKKNVRRTPENLLLFFAFLGPFGAWGGMQVFRHKTQKITFYLVPLFDLFHGALLFVLILP